MEQLSLWPGAASLPLGLLENSWESVGEKWDFGHKPRLAMLVALGESCPTVCGIWRPREARIPLCVLDTRLHHGREPGCLRVRLGSQYRPFCVT